MRWFSNFKYFWLGFIVAGGFKAWESVRELCDKLKLYEVGPDGRIAEGIAELDANQTVPHEKVAKWLTTWGKPGEIKAPR